MGAALGGGSMEAALGAETSSLLTKITIYAVIAFFVLTFVLYLGNISLKKSVAAESGEGLLSEIAEETTAATDSTSGDVTSDSALQQIINIGEEAAEDAVSDAVTDGETAVAEGEAAIENLGAQAETVAEEVVSEAEAVESEVEDAVNP